MNTNRLPGNALLRIVASWLQVAGLARFWGWDFGGWVGVYLVRHLRIGWDRIGLDRQQRRLHDTPARTVCG